MFMKTSVPYSYRFLVLVYMSLDSYIGGDLTFERFTKQNKRHRVCNSRKLYMQYVMSCRNFYLEEKSQTTESSSSI